MLFSWIFALLAGGVILVSLNSMRVPHLLRQMFGNSGTILDKEEGEKEILSLSLSFFSTVVLNKSPYPTLNRIIFVIFFGLVGFFHCQFSWNPSPSPRRY